MPIFKDRTNKGINDDYGATDVIGSDDDSGAGDGKSVDDNVNANHVAVDIENGANP